MEEKKIPVGGKYSLSIKEAADYFSIGTKKMRRLAEDHLGTFSAYNGNRYLIIRAEFEAYLKKSPIMQKPQEEGEELKRAQLEDKSIFNPEEAIAFYDLSRRRFKKLLEGEEELPFVAYFKNGGNKEWQSARFLKEEIQNIEFCGSASQSGRMACTSSSTM